MIVYISLIVLISLLHVWYVVRSNNAIEKYWKQYGVPFYRGKFGFGFGIESILLFGKKPVFEVLDDIYKMYPDAPVVATKLLYKQALLIRDPKNIHQIMAGDFNTYSHRGFDLNGDIDVLADNVLFMNGIRWKLTRQKMTPLFTSSKLRNMYYIMDNCAQDFVNYMKHNNKSRDLFNVLCSYCSATISAAVFGIGTKSTMESPFMDMAREAFKQSFINDVKFALATTWHSLFKFLKIQLFNKHKDFFIRSMKQVLQDRKQSNLKKYDFADLCLEVQKKGIMRDGTTGYELEPTDELLSAQAFFFFAAGIEPSAVSMFYTLWELIRHPDILERVQKDIDELFVSNNEKLSYENIAEYEYLDRVIDEAMRIHPPVASISRKSTQRGILPVGNIPVDVNIQLRIPVISIHNDPKFYPNPEVFDPERFTAEEKCQRPPSTHMVFGEGNRMCLGMRFARLQVKIGLVHILRNFTVKINGTDKKSHYKKETFFVRPKDITDFEFISRF